MNKEELFKELSVKINSGEIKREEIVNHFGLMSAVNTVTTSVPVVETEKHSYFTINKILYFLGAAIVVVGIVTFISQIWTDIGSFGRIIVTLGLGFITTGVGSMLVKSKPEDAIGKIFHVIGGVLIPSGALVTLNELSTGIDHPWVVASTFIIICAFYLLLNALHKSVVLTFFAIVNGTSAIYLVVNAISDGSAYSMLDVTDIYKYLTMAIGVSYILLGQSFRDTWNDKIVGPLYFFGVTGFLGTTFSMVFDSVAWQLLYFVIIVGGFSLSVYLKSRSILVMSTIFLIAHFSYITGKYFADSLGWPVSLVVLGFLFIGLGFMSVNLNRKYIKGQDLPK